MGQNTLVFNLDTALRMMGDVAEYYVQNNIRNHYFVSISGYHIAEAGANPTTQAALTLSNGLTYVELFKARGLDPINSSETLVGSSQMEWTQNSRNRKVARRIWAIAMRDIYGEDIGVSN